MIEPMSRTSFPVACIQLSSRDDIEANLDACEAAIVDVAQRGSRVILLPENFAWFGDDRTKAQIAEVLGDRDAPIQKRLSRIARNTATTIIGGGMPEVSSDSSRPFNTCVVFGPGGSIAARYRKVHLFDVELPGGVVMRESRSTSAGSSTEVVSIEGVPVGLSVCYDLRFPELYRALVDAGAEVLVVPAAFTLQTGRDHWHTLLRARAIESTAWVLAANQWGDHPLGRSTYGHSLIVDPWGTIIAECSDGPGALVATLDMALLDGVRQRLPSLQHRRL